MTSKVVFSNYYYHLVITSSIAYAHIAVKENEMQLSQTSSDKTNL